MSLTSATQGSPLNRFLSDGWITTRRNLLKIRRVPDVLVFSLIQPVMFVLLFTYVYGGVIDIPGSSYVEFLMAGIFAQTVVFGSTYSGSAMAQDLKDGIIDRFRTLPMSPAAVLVGRTSGDMVINASSMVVMMLTGFIVGWRIRSSFLEAAFAVVLLLLFAYSFSWVMAFIGIGPVSANVHFQRVRPIRHASCTTANFRRMESCLCLGSSRSRVIREYTSRHSHGGHLDCAESYCHCADWDVADVGRVCAVID
jgi:hypothetical protein